MLEELVPAVRGLILDMDGVLWKDATPIGDLPAIFKAIGRKSLKVVLATNNSTKTVEEYLAILLGFGIRLEPWQIVTSSIATAHHLSKIFPDRGAIFVIGENGIHSALQEKGFHPISDPDDATHPVAVVAAIDRNVTYQKLRRATLHIRSGIPFYGTNSDRTFPTPEGLVPGAGSLLAAITAATDVDPIVIGKPASSMLEQSVERMNLDLESVMVVGDRLETDISGGQRMGLRTALVLSGVSTKAEALAWSPSPTLIAQDLSALAGLGSDS